MAQVVRGVSVRNLSFTVFSHVMIGRKVEFYMYLFVSECRDVVDLRLRVDGPRSCRLQNRSTRGRIIEQNILHMKATIEC